MADIDELVRLDPMEQVHYEKEQNLYSIIKTVEYLVSLDHHNILKKLVLTVTFTIFRNSHTPQEKYRELSMTINSAHSSINTNYAPNPFRISAVSTHSWTSIASSIANQPNHSWKQANLTTKAKKLIETWPRECLTLQLSLLHLRMCLRWTLDLLMSYSQPLEMSSRHSRTILTSPLIIRAWTPLQHGLTKWALWRHMRS